MRIIVIAGPNGAGKTTFARRYLEGLEGNRPFVNGDDIAARLNPANPASVAQTAGRMALREMDTLVAQRADFAVETTLSGRGYARRIRGWQAAGYRVSVIYLRLSSADQTVERVAKRVSEGGHDIPESVARRRFNRSWSNFCDLYREIADDWRVYDNSGEAPVLIAQSRGWQEVREPPPEPRIPQSGSPDSRRRENRHGEAAIESLSRRGTVRQERAGGPQAGAGGCDGEAGGGQEGRARLPTPSRAG